MYAGFPMSDAQNSIKPSLARHKCQYARINWKDYGRRHAIYVAVALLIGFIRKGKAVRTTGFRAMSLLACIFIRTGIHAVGNLG